MTQDHKIASLMKILFNQRQLPFTDEDTIPGNRLQSRKSNAVFPHTLKLEYEDAFQHLWVKDISHLELL
jgi:hypothetical protein